MPVYCYECDDCGLTSEEFHFRSQPPASLACPACGGPARRSYAAESGRATSRPREAASEIRSVAAGVMPSQAAHAEAALAARGVDGVRFDRRTGDAVFRDRPSRLRALRAMRLHDKDEVRG